LLAAQSTIPRGLLLMRLAKRLEDQLALTEEAARWAVDSWALALSLITDAELEELKAKQVEALPPTKTNESSRLKIEDDGVTKSSSATPSKPQASTKQQPPQQQQPPPTRSKQAPLARPANPPVAKPAIAAPSRTGGAIRVQQQTPVSSTSPALPASEPADYSQDLTLKQRAGRWRGCVVGCFLLILLSLLLFLVAPYVISLLRDEQRQNDPPPSVRPQ
jgi:hypothetical protein